MRSKPPARAWPLTAHTSGVPRSKPASRAVRDVAQPREGLRVDALAAREALRGGDRRPHVHAGAEDAVAGAREHRAADLLVARDAPPRGRELAQHVAGSSELRLGTVDRDERDVRVIGRELETRSHAGRLPSHPRGRQRGADADHPSRARRLTYRQRLHAHRK